MPKEDLYQRIDEDEEMTDQEKRETYFAEIEKTAMGILLVIKNVLMISSKREMNFSRTFMMMNGMIII